MTENDIVNLLLLGETGVGKSTWINAFANYLSFTTLDEAKNGQPVCLISTNFSFTDQHRKTHIVKIGDFVDESEEVGRSGTLKSMSYVFRSRSHGRIRLIDTPGVGDTEGPEQDQINLDNVLRYISTLPHLHGICILLKANETKLTVSFRYRINELLTHLNKTAAQNIIFCFTNSRSTFFEPGDSDVILKNFLARLQSENGVELVANDDTMFYLDNEAFRYLMASRQGIEISPGHLSAYRTSWATSKDTTHRLLNWVSRLDVHKIEDTVSVNNARNVILNLAKPLADLSNQIELNMTILRRKQKELDDHNGTREELLTKLQIRQVGYEVKPLGHPRTICTAAKCVDTMRIPNTDAMQTIYKTHCHSRCYLNGVEKDRVPNPAIQECEAMWYKTLKCSHCECNWSLHMHIDYDQLQVAIQVVDPTIQDAIDKNFAAHELQSKAKQLINNQLKQLQYEQVTILKTGAQFGTYLKANAIKPYNDAIRAYLKYSIKEEERLIAADQTNNTRLETYKRNLEVYEQQKAILDQALANSEATLISTDEVKELVTELEKLPLNGPTLKELFNAAVIGDRVNFDHIEKHYDLETGELMIAGSSIQNGMQQLRVF